MNENQNCQRSKKGKPQLGEKAFGEKKTKKHHLAGIHLHERRKEASASAHEKVRYSPKTGAKQENAVTRLVKTIPLKGTGPELHQSLRAESKERKSLSRPKWKGTPPRKRPQRDNSDWGNPDPPISPTKAWVDRSKKSQILENSPIKKQQPGWARVRSRGTSRRVKTKTVVKKNAEEKTRTSNR